MEENKKVDQLTLPRLISHGMVLQRESKTRIWGHAPSRDTITISFLGKSYTTVSGINSYWEIHLTDLAPGGPHDMEIRTTKSGSVTVRDIMIGDVFICSGQSNMEHTLGSLAPHYDEETRHCTNPMIRHFAVPVRAELCEPKEDFEDGSWLPANPENVLSFTAVGYFFAKELYEQYKIPIGLINASQGGSPAESWMSENILKAYPSYFDTLTKFKDPEFAAQQAETTQNQIDGWYNTLYEKDLGKQEGKTPWYDKNYHDSDWKTIRIPGKLNETEIGPLIGIIWFRKTIIVPPEMAGKKATLLLGTIQDADTVYVNGTFVGETGYIYPRRNYKIPEGILTEGANTITIRLISNEGSFGFVKGKEYSLAVTASGKKGTAENCAPLKSASQASFHKKGTFLSNEKTKSDQTNKIDLSGDWKYKISLSLDKPRTRELFMEWLPGTLFKGMLAPVLPYTIKGAVWYQGESNESRAEEYRVLFPDLIKDWRKQFNIGDFPFLFVQLPNLGEYSSDFTNEGWAPLRDAQDNALTLPATGMAVTYDVGEWNDLHPLDKASVGKRLAFVARKVVYGKNIVYTGPSLREIKKTEDGYRLFYDNQGSGLTTTNNQPLRHFVLVDADGTSTEADAVIDGNTIILKAASPKDSDKPYTECRYAYAANPETANLCNKEGFPAAPFRKMLT